MHGIGIKKSRSIEIVDATIRNGVITAATCPGNLGISCTLCSHAWKTEPAHVRPGRRKDPASPIIVCHWHEASAGKP